MARRGLIADGYRNKGEDMGDLAHKPCQGAKAVLLVDPRVKGWMSLTADVDPTTKVVLVDTERDAVEQMRGALSDYRDLSAVHLLAHGEAGRIQIGRAGIDAASIDEHAQELASIGASLADGAAIYIHGCEVAKGDVGRAFVHLLSEKVGAPVLAATHRIGNEGHGASWELDVATGCVAARFPFSRDAMAAFEGTLIVTPVDLTPDDLNDVQDRGGEIAFLPGGNLVVVYDHDASPSTAGNPDNSIGIQIIQPDGTSLTGEIFDDLGGGASPNDPQVAVLDATHFVVAWSEFAGAAVEINAQIYTIGPGNTVTGGGIFTISDDTITHDDNGNGLQIEALPNGNFIVAWAQFYNNFANARMVVRTFDSDGNPLSPVTQIGEQTNTGTSRPYLSVDGSNVAVLWSQNEAGGDGSVHALAYSFTVNPDGTIPALTLNDIDVGDHTSPHEIVHLANGDILVLFTGGPIQGGSLDDNDQLSGIIYSPGFASVVQGPFEINPDVQPTGVSNSTAVAFAGGGFQVFWTQDPFDAVDGGQTDFELYSVVYDSTYTATGAPVLQTADGINDYSPNAVVDGAGNVTITWQNGSPGTLYLAQLLDQDPNANTPPVENANTGMTLSEGASNSITAAQLDFNDAEEADGDITYTLTSLPANGTLELLGGSLSLGSTFTQADIGNGLLSYVHDGSETTTDSFGFSVSDGTTTIAGQTFSLTITPVDDASISRDDAFGTDEASAILGGDLFADNGSGADSDPDGPALSITEVNGSAANVGAQIVLASGALLTVNADGTFDYDPNGMFDYLPGSASGASNLTGTETFTYTLAGGGTATVTITVGGVDSDDILTGTAAGETLSAGVGDDFVEGFGGADVIDGGDGNDTASYTGSSAAVQASLATGSATGGDAEGDTFVSIENLAGSIYGDLLWGNAGANVLRGNGGDDILEGLAGADLLDGGSGNDTASYANSAAAVQAALAGNTAGGDAAGDVFVSIENLTGSAHGDMLAGDAGANVLRGLGGDDTLEGGAGNDLLDGGDGTDTASYAGAALAVSVNLTAGTASGADIGIDTLVSIEHVTGGAGGDVLVGNGGVNRLDGGGGGDTLSGQDGNDLLLGGAGNDAVSGGLGDDLLYGHDGDDSLTGNDGADTIYGAAGADVMNGGEGNDTIYGNSGNDEIAGGNGDDTLYGGGDRDVILGGAGNDTIYGEAGDDNLGAGLVGGLGDDFIDGGGGNDLINGNDGADSLHGGAGNDLVYGGNDNDTITGGAGSDTLYGQAGDDVMFGAIGVDQLFGGVGNDRLDGGESNDTLRGGDGEDILNGGLHNDALWGEAGTDRFVFGDGWGRDTIHDFADDGLEKIDLSAVTGIDSLADLTVTNASGGALIAFGLNTITVVGLTAASLDNSDFIF